MESVLYDGIDLTQGYTVFGVVRPLPNVSPEYEPVPGGDRNFMRGVEYTPPLISFNIMKAGLSATAKREAAHDLAKKLLRKTPVKVQFGSDNGLYYMAVPEGAMEFHEFVRCGSMQVNLMPVEAAMYGAEKTASGAAGGQVTINVGGTYKTVLSITCSSATRNTSSLVWGVRLNDGRFQRVELPVATCAVAIDGTNRTVKANNVNTQLTLASDWLEVEPGSHVVRNDQGSGAFTVKWQERWL